MCFSVPSSFLCEEHPKTSVQSRGGLQMVGFTVPVTVVDLDLDLSDLDLDLSGSV